VSVPSGSQISLVWLLSGFTFIVNLTPFDTGRVCIPLLTPHPCVLAAILVGIAFIILGYAGLLEAVTQFRLICQQRKNHIAPTQIHNALAATFSKQAWNF
jgi:hypothetical protein